MTQNLTKTCPHCGEPMPINFGFITWCDRCNYNLENETEVVEEKPKSMFQRLWVWMSKRSGEGLFQQAMASTDLRPRLTLSLLLAYGLALLIHAFTLWIFATALVWSYGILLDVGVLHPTILVLRLVVVVLMLLLVWKLRPHVGRVPADAVRREQAESARLTALFALMDQIAAELGTPRIQAIQITPDFTAALSQEGLKGEYVLHLGLPFLVVLDQQELVALLAHEMAHSVNGDPLRVWLIGSAVHTLMEWADLFFIGRFIVLQRPGYHAMLVLLFQAVMRLLSGFAWLGGTMMSLLLYPTMQRAEYYADALSARAAGTEAALNLARKSYLRQATRNIYLKARFQAATRIIHEIRERMGSVPQREWLRIERVIEKGVSRFESTHPSTKHRMAYIRSRPQEAGQVVLPAAEFQRIMDGLRGFEVMVEQKIRSAMPEAGH